MTVIWEQQVSAHPTLGWPQRHVCLPASFRLRHVDLPAGADIQRSDWRDYLGGIQVEREGSADSPKSQMLLFFILDVTNSRRGHLSLHFVSSLLKLLQTNLEHYQDQCNNTFVAEDQHPR